MIDNTSDSSDLRVQVARLDERMTGVGGRVDQVHQKLDSFVAEIRSGYATQSALAVVDGKVNDLRDSQKWLVRLIIGAVVLAVIGVVVKMGGVPRG